MDKYEPSGTRGVTRNGEWFAGFGPAEVADLIAFIRTTRMIPFEEVDSGQ